MSTATDILSFINQYLKTHDTLYVDFQQLLAFVRQFAQEHEPNNPKFEDIRRDAHQTVIQHLKTLEFEGVIEIKIDENQTMSVYYEAFFHERISDYYQRILADLTLPFPRVETITLPKDRIRAVDIKENFISLLHDWEQSVNIIRIVFPNDIDSVIITTPLLPQVLLLSAIQKIRQYLHKEHNFTYMLQKLIPLFPAKGVPIKNLLMTITQSPDMVIGSVQEPTGFSFQLWTQLSTFIIKEYESKIDKTDEDNNYIQAGYLIGYYCVYYKGSEQKKEVDSKAMSKVSQLMKRPPYAFTIESLRNLKDERRLNVFKRIKPGTFENFVKENTKIPEGDSISPLLQLTLPDGNKLYLYSRYIGHVLDHHRLQAGKDFYAFYKNSWYSALMENDLLNTMNDDTEFRRHVTARLLKHCPILFTVLDFDLLLSMTYSKEIPEPVKLQCLEYMHLNRKTMKDYDVILRLNRRQILNDVRSILPAWLTMPLLRSLVFFFRRLFLGKGYRGKYQAQSVDHEGQLNAKKSHRGQAGEEISASADAEGSSSHAHRGAAFREKIKSYEEHFLQEGESLDLQMKELIHLWNPLIEGNSRQELVEDVNSMCRSCIRRLKITYRSAAPDLATLRELSKRLADDDTFDRIRNRKELERYIQLYFLKLLSR